MSTNKVSRSCQELDLKNILIPKMTVYKRTESIETASAKNCNTATTVKTETFSSMCYATVTYRTCYSNYANIQTVAVQEKSSHSGRTAHCHDNKINQINVYTITFVPNLRHDTRCWTGIMSPAPDATTTFFSLLLLHLTI